MTPELLTANIEKRGRAWYSLYSCKCGSTFLALKGNITAGSTTSCGCVKKAMTIAQNTTHGLSSQKPRLYRIWKGMRKRCKSVDGHKNYGARGISVCQSWTKYPAFYHWSLANEYADNLSIDRIDVNGNYEPSNCRWATDAQQAHNTRTSIGEVAAIEIRASMLGKTRKKGCGVNKLAQAYGVGRSTIKMVLRGQTYKNIPPAPHDIHVIINRNA